MLSDYYETKNIIQRIKPCSLAGACLVSGLLIAFRAYLGYLGY